MIPALTKDGEKTDAWWDAYEEGYADALKDIEHKLKMSELTRREQ